MFLNVKVFLALFFSFGLVQGATATDSAAPHRHLTGSGECWAQCSEDCNSDVPPFVAAAFSGVKVLHIPPEVETQYLTLVISGAGLRVYINDAIAVNITDNHRPFIDGVITMDNHQLWLGVLINGEHRLTQRRGIFGGFVAELKVFAGSEVRIEADNLVDITAPKLLA